MNQLIVFKLYVIMHLNIFRVLRNCLLKHYTMQSREEKHSSPASDNSSLHTPITVKQGSSTTNRDANRTSRWDTRRVIRTPPDMYSDPVDGSDSDTESFHADELYGSDSGGETISLRTAPKQQSQSSDESVVCTFAEYFYSKYLMCGAGQRSHAKVREVGNGYR